MLVSNGLSRLTGSENYQTKLKVIAWPDIDLHMQVPRPASVFSETFVGWCFPDPVRVVVLVIYMCITHLVWTKFGVVRLQSVIRTVTGCSREQRVLSPGHSNKFFFFLLVSQW